MFETLLSVDFILEADQLHRALSYEYISFKNQETVLRNIINNSNLNEMEKDKAQKTLKGIEQKSEDAKYNDIKKEWDRLHGKGKYHPNWYSLVGVSVNNLNELSKHLGLDNIYREFYKIFSESIHATNTLQDIKLVNAQEFILPLRTPSELQNNSFLSVILTVRIFRIIIRNYLPEKLSVHQKWYIENITQKVKLLFASGKLININLVESPD
jgi:hypothetical protein